MKPWLAIVGLSAALAGCGGDEADAEPTLAAAACEGVVRWEVPADPSRRGPWAVGARTETIAGLTAEIWYPAVPRSDRGKAAIRYDLREQLPDFEQGKIPDEDNPWLVCDCQRDLPFDDAHGPYPMVLFIHGTGGFRTQSLSFMTHWASRGFVVVAADHPRWQLRDVLQFNLGGDQPGDATRILDAVVGGQVPFLAGKVATDRMAISGHSAGGAALAGFSSRPGVKVLIPMAAGGAEPGTVTTSTLVMGALDDHIVPWSRQMSGFGTTTTPRRRLIGLGNAGHLAFSEICALGREEGGLLGIAVKHDVYVSPIISDLAVDGCAEGQLDPARGWTIVQAATTAVLEESLACSATATAQIAEIPQRFKEVVEFSDIHP